MAKILVIDDEPFILMMIEDKLKKAGYIVLTSRKSSGIIDVIRREMPDLIILDWMMPEVSGIEVCNDLKGDPDLSSIPVFMLTAKGQEDDEKMGLQCGVERYITKPFSPKLLLEMVDETVGNR